MSANNLSVDGEFRYVVQWFNEWSELQREDFLPILIECLAKDGPVIYMNGIVSGMAAASCIDKPMSLFQCRIKLFKEWSGKWPEDLKLKLKEKIIELDDKLGEKLQEELSTGLTNGNGTGEQQQQAADAAAADAEEPESEPAEPEMAPATVAVDIIQPPVVVVVPVVNEEVPLNA